MVVPSSLISCKNNERNPLLDKRWNLFLDHKWLFLLLFRRQDLFKEPVRISDVLFSILTLNKVSIFLHLNLLNSFNSNSLSYFSSYAKLISIFIFEKLIFLYPMCLFISAFAASDKEDTLYPRVKASISDREKKYH